MSIEKGNAEEGTKTGETMKKKNFFQRMKMPLTELEEYYRECRANAYENNDPIKGIKWRQKVHFLLIAGLRISRIISGKKLHIINDQHIDTGKPLIYACTHIGWSDVEMAIAAIKSHAYPFWGDPGEMYRRIVGFLFSSMELYVVIPVISTTAL